MSDLSSILNMAPTTGAFLMGQNNSLEQALTEARRRSLEEEMRIRANEDKRNADMAPLKMEHQRLQNIGMQGTNAGQLIQNDANALKLKSSQATFDSDIAATQAKNQGIVDEEGDKKGARAQKFMMEAGAELAGIPVMMRAQHLRSMMEQRGMNLNSPQLQQMLQQANNPSFPQMMQQLAERLGAQAEAMNPAARSAKEVARIKAAQDKYDTDKRTGATIRAAEIGAASRENVAKEKAGKTALSLMQQAAIGKIKAKELPMAFELAAKEIEKTDPDQAIYLRDLAQKQELMNRDLANANKPQPAPIPGVTQPPTPTRMGDSKPRGSGTADDPIILK